MEPGGGVTSGASAGTVCPEDATKGSRWTPSRAPARSFAATRSGASSWTPDAYAVLRRAATEAPVHRRIRRSEGRRHLPLPRLRRRAVRLRHEVRLALRLAELHRSDGRRRGRAAHATASHGMVRTEVAVRALRRAPGHVFDDGPGASGQRYCINSVALDFDADAATDRPASPSGGRRSEALGAGQQRLGLRAEAEAAGRARRARRRARPARRRDRRRRRWTGRGRGTRRPARAPCRSARPRPPRPGCR